MWHTDTGWGWWVSMWFGMVAFWGLLIWGVVYLARSGSLERRAAPARPEDVLGERLARGEIDVPEYRRRLEALHAAPDARAGAPAPGTGELRGDAAP